MGRSRPAAGALLLLLLLLMKTSALRPEAAGHLGWRLPQEGAPAAAGTAGASLAANAADPERVARHLSGVPEGGEGGAEPHRVRHGKARHQHQHHQHQARTAAPAAAPTAVTAAAPAAATAVPAAAVAAAAVAPDVDSGSDAPTTTAFSHELGEHRVASACYGGSEVLLVVAATCAVNLTFMLAVLAIVLACNRHSKPDPDWNANRGSPPPVVVKGGVERAGDRSCSYSSVQQYVDSLPVELDAPGSLLSLHSLGRDRTASAAPSAHSGSPRTTTAAQGPAGSFSMEDLLFLD